MKPPWIEKVRHPFIMKTFQEKLASYPVPPYNNPILGSKAEVEPTRDNPLGLSDPMTRREELLEELSEADAAAWFAKNGPTLQQAVESLAHRLPADASDRKKIPIATGVLDYFPDAIVAIAEVSQAGNDQHNPGTAVHWDRAKSGDEADSMIRHFIQRGTYDKDGLRHSAKMAWRSLAYLQKEIETEKGIRK